MSLPAGTFSGEHGDLCPTCNGQIYWEQAEKRYTCRGGCVNKKATISPYGREPMEIPITKHQLGLYTWYGVLGFCIVLCGLAIIGDAFFGIMMLIMVLVVSHIIGFGVLVAIMAWTTEETFPWLKSIMGTHIETGWHFKTEREGQ